MDLLIHPVGEDVPEAEAVDVAVDEEDVAVAVAVIVDGKEDTAIITDTATVIMDITMNTLLHRPERRLWRF